MNQEEKIVKLATEVMGWELSKPASLFEIDPTTWVLVDRANDTAFMFEDWNPYENWNHAGMLWDKLNERGNIRIDQMVDGGQCSCNLTLWSGDGEYGAYAPSFPAAISDTALATIEATK